MKYLVLLLLIVTIIGGGIFVYQKTRLPDGQIKPTKLESNQSTKITPDQAVKIVKDLPEVKEYLGRVPNGKVMSQNNDINEGAYLIQVFEVKDGHTATFNWYRVNVKDGSIEAEFDFTKGIVSGKLCYPSDVVPRGRLEVKNIRTGNVDYEDYPGYQNEGENTYSFQLEEGDYYLRYKVTDDLIGYSTTVCPTGKEETCGDTKPRIARKAEVKIGETIANYDLCDYFYKLSNAPKF